MFYVVIYNKLRIFVPVSISLMERTLLLLNKFQLYIHYYLFRNFSIIMYLLSNLIYNANQMYVSDLQIYGCIHWVKLSLQ